MLLGRKELMDVSVDALNRVSPLSLEVDNFFGPPLLYAKDLALWRSLVISREVREDRLLQTSNSNFNATSSVYQLNTRLNRRRIM